MDGDNADEDEHHFTCTYREMDPTRKHPLGDGRLEPKPNPAHPQRPTREGEIQAKVTCQQTKISNLNKPKIFHPTQRGRVVFLILGRIGGARDHETTTTMLILWHVAGGAGAGALCRFCRCCS